MAANKGKLFEQQVRKSCLKDGLLYVNLPDSNKFGFGEQTRFTPDNPFDCLVYDGNNLWLLELKTTCGGSLSFNQPPYEKVKGQQPMIKPHQVKSLMEYDKYPGTRSGLLIDFQDRQTKTRLVNGGCYFIPIHDFVNWTLECGKKSINIEDTRKIGIEVGRKKLKTNYTYDIKGLTERGRENEN